MCLLYDFSRKKQGHERWKFRSFSFMYEIYPYLKLKKKERKARSFWIKIKFLKFRDTMSLRTRFWIIELISSCDKDKIETLLR